MLRLLSITLGALCLVYGRASADPLRHQEIGASDISSRQRCVCSLRRPTHVTHFTHYRIARYARYRTFDDIGYDPLPYRFGYFPEPYRYRHRVAILTARQWQAAMEALILVANLGDPPCSPGSES